MSNFIAFIGGTMLGTFIGTLVISLCIMAKTDEEFNNDNE